MVTAASVYSCGWFLSQTQLPCWLQCGTSLLCPLQLSADPPSTYFIAPGIPHAVTPKGHCWLTACIDVCVCVSVCAKYLLYSRQRSFPILLSLSICLHPCHASCLPPCFFFPCFSTLHLAAVSLCNCWVGVLPPLFLKWRLHQQTLQQHLS